MMYALSNLDSGNLQAIQSLEKDIGLPVIAMSSVAIEPTALDGEKLRKVQKLEQELGIVLVAVKQN